MPEQLSFDLPVRNATGRGDFFVSPANLQALQEIDRWPDWPAGKLVLTGPAGAGKSHLAQVWAGDAGARVIAAVEIAHTTPQPGHWVIEDADQLAGDPTGETALFHLHNLVLAEGGRLLLTARSAPSRWPITLPDLASRLSATPLARLEPPDDALLAAVLMKLFADRQIDPPASLIPWLLKRIDRSFEAAGRMVADLDARSLATGRPIGHKLAGDLLDDLGA